MRTKLTLSFLALSGLGVGPISVLVPTSPAQEGKNTSDVRTLTGCLEKGDKADGVKDPSRVSLA
jgi:hypothetical protein